MGKTTLLIALFIAGLSVHQAKLPEEDLLVPELIHYWGYPVEVHEAKTDDGYYLTLHRIPHGRDNLTNKTRPAAFLQHGLLCSSSNWVANPPDESLGFMLADAGFDVWMGNVRGNTYSKKHETFSATSVDFWDFSVDEMSKYDLPAMVMYVLQNTTQKELYYIGHSQGTMMLFAGLSENKELQGRIKVAFALAPVTRLKNIYSPIKVFAPFESEFKITFEVLGIHQFLPSCEVIQLLADKVCPIDEKMCATISYLVAGYDKKGFNLIIYIYILFICC